MSNTTAIVGTIANVVALAVAGRLTGISTKVQDAIHTYDQQADAKIDELQAALDKQETSNATVQEVIAGVKQIATAAGFALPSEDKIFAAIKASVDDLAGSLVPTT